MNNQFNQSNAAIFVNAIIQNQASDKIKLAIALQDEINVEKSQDIASMMIKDAAKQRIAELNKMILSNQKVDAKEIERLKADNYALIIQHYWKSQRARKRQTELRTKKKLLVQEWAALKLQSSWRIKQAKNSVQKLKADREKEKLEKNRIKQMQATAAILIQKIYRGHSKKIRIQELYRSCHPHVLTVNIKSAKGINVGDSMVSDPYVIISCYSLSSRPTFNYSQINSQPGTVFNIIHILSYLFDFIFLYICIHLSILRSERIKQKEKRECDKWSYER